MGSLQCFLPCFFLLFSLLFSIPDFLFLWNYATEQGQNWEEGWLLHGKHYSQISARSVEGFWTEGHFTTFIINSFMNDQSWTKRRLFQLDLRCWAASLFCILPQISSFLLIWLNVTETEQLIGWFLWSGCLHTCLCCLWLAASV